MEAATPFQESAVIPMPKEMRERMLKEFNEPPFISAKKRHTEFPMTGSRLSEG